MSQQYNMVQKLQQTWQRWSVWLYVVIREEIISTEKLIPRSTVGRHNCTHSTLSIQREQIADRWRWHTLINWLYYRWVTNICCSWTRCELNYTTGPGYWQPTMTQASFEMTQAILDHQCWTTSMIISSSKLTLHYQDMPFAKTSSIKNAYRCAQHAILLAFSIEFNDQLFLANNFQNSSKYLPVYSQAYEHCLWGYSIMGLRYAYCYYYKWKMQDKCYRVTPVKWQKRVWMDQFGLP